MNAISTATAGILNGFARFDAASADLSRAFQPGSTSDPASPIVDQLSAAQQVQAGVSTLRASDRMLHQLLDITV